MNKRNFNIIFVVAIVLIGLCFIYDKMTSLDPNSQIVSNLYSLLGGSKLEYCDGMVIYADKKVDYNSLDLNTKMCMAYKLIEDEQKEIAVLNKTKKKNYCYLNKTDGFLLDKDKKECTVEQIQKGTLEEKYSKLFNEAINEDSNVINISGTEICYLTDAGYQCGKAISQSVEVGWTPTLYRVITKVKAKDDQILIYDSFLLVNNDKCYVMNDADTEYLECSQKLKEVAEINEKFVTTYGKKYVHEFKLNTNTNDYYWVSTTPLK